MELIQFDSWNAFIAMGGYGSYVWSAMFITFASLGGLALQVALKRRQLVRGAQAQQARTARIERSRERQRAGECSSSTSSNTTNKLNTSTDHTHTL